MMRTISQWLSLPLLALALIGCERLFPKRIPPRTTSKDFWIDRCEITYRGKVFPITGTIEEMVRLLGPAERADTSDLDHSYFWDSLGLKVHLVWKSRTQVSEISLYFAREESSYEKGLRLGERPEGQKDLAEVRASYPQRFFQGELILEGAVIGPIIDFKQVNETRIAYMKSQTGPDAGLRSAQWRPDPGLRLIRESWSSTRYGYERFCTDGRHLRFIFTLISGVPPLRLQSLSIGSDNVPDSAATPSTPEGSTLQPQPDPGGSSTP